MKKIWCVLKDNWVIDRVLWDGITPWEYPSPYDIIIEDTDESLAIGDWYEQVEGIFYRPLKTPPDYPN
jgi:hypothetical protein